MTHPSMFVITEGDNIYMAVGPFPTEEAAHAYYRSNQPQGLVYLRPPTIRRLLAPNPKHVPQDSESTA